MRKLYSARDCCKAGCKYCFAKWKDLYAAQPDLGVEMYEKESSIIYPFCDSEIFDLDNCFDDIMRISQPMKNVYISISTKCGMSAESFSIIKKLDHYLREQGKGFVKLSVSVSTKTRIDELEPGTLSYEDRHLFLKMADDAGFLTSVTIKPLLPFIPLDEYLSIMDDFSSVTPKFLIGGLYVNRDSLFFRQYIKGKYETTQREVTWLCEKPTWDYIGQDSKIQEIKAYASNQHYSVYESDEQVILSFIRTGGDCHA